ncbi:GNAT family N-acetyltransferase [Lacrimispora celerecrescens]|uniref:Ribosomal protein S18 acetylase RimI-like enzyme n=1 Tax=[Clostridium] celerecrescens 18A TaxID=1286362 RepID=A0A2M8Z5D1_9FIRM|nr:GNAT family N-acetyltransferase [Lacrimispora celerecrescens]PJJ28635.1 ribosomal protein S18 acetylase RimI-like enzyme [[Clostridium] celerecrescens 18A]
MDSDRLYRVKKDDVEKLKELLTECFAGDPLYCRLIPDGKTRSRLLPELFECDMEEFLETCEIYADSPDINGILVVDDESQPYNAFHYYLAEAAALLKTDGYLIKEDPSLKTFWNFFQGREYLNSSWTDRLNQEKRLHLIYLAVRPAMQHHGISSLLLREAIDYADKNKLMISLETHNVSNVKFYEHFDFKVFCIVEKRFRLKQYCMVRDIK